MQIAEILSPQGILLGGFAADKVQALRRMVQLMDGCGVLSDPVAYEQDVFAREAQGTTGLGGGIAIPHAKSAAVKRPAVVAMTVPQGLEYAALDGQPVKLLFMIAAPDNASDLHVKVLASLAMLLMDHDFCDQLMTAATPQAFLAQIEERERAQQAEKAHEAPPRQPYRILAVTACPTGIAHTYMAAEALSAKAQELGIPIKIETNGATGVQNQLTGAEIEQAECILVAADKAVPMARFEGKPLIRVPVSDAIRQPERLLQRAASGMAKPYQADTGAPQLKTTIASDTGNFVHRLYMDLMNGISAMLPFVTGGGILIALGYVLDRANIGEAIFGSGNSLSWALTYVGEAALTLMYPVLAAYIAYSIADMPALLPGFLGGYLASRGATISTSSRWVPSAFWGALIAGFAAGLLMYLICRMGKKLPKVFDQVKLTLFYPVIGLILIGFLMLCIVNPPLGRFNVWLYQLLTTLHGGSRLVFIAVLAGMMAMDFGGPINKAAYLFGTMALTNGRQDIMAAVMIGGMVPPIAVALACTFFPNRFTEAERHTTITNYLLGVSFVTEGALPFALRDPLRVIPSCMVGAAVAGVLSLSFGCTVPAPHGGLYLLPLMDHPGGYVLALLVGGVVSALLLCLLKKPIRKPD